MTPAKYAAGTSVPVQRSLLELQTLAAKFGAGKFGYATDADRAVVTFEAARARDRASMDRLAVEETARRQAGVVLDWDDDDPVADHDGPCCLHRGGPP